MKKVTLFFPSKPPSKTEILSSPYFLKIWWQVQRPPPRHAERGGCTLRPPPKPQTNFVKKFQNYLLKATYYCIIEFVYVYQVITSLKSTGVIKANNTPVSCW